MVCAGGGKSIMDDNKSFEDIMKEITHGLTGDPVSDMKYLEEQEEKYSKI